MDWSGKKVAITGAAGFIGSHLCERLVDLGADVTALVRYNSRGSYGFMDDFAKETQDKINVVLGDITDQNIFRAVLPGMEVVFHLAAQSLVRRSYRLPVETFATNVLGTVTLLDLVRQTEGVRAVVVATSDKAYENAGQIWGYRETDPMGGHDPYSASKGAAEIATATIARCSAFIFHPFP